VDVLVNGSHGGASPVGFLPCSEGDEVERPQRSPESPPEIVSEVGVFGDTGRDERVGDLEQHGRTAAEERRHRG